MPAHAVTTPTSARREAQKKRLLPSPPTTKQKYLYLGAKQRWVILVQAIAHTLIIVSTVKFILHVPYTEIFLFPLLLSALSYAVSLFTTVQPRRDDRPGHDLKVDLYRPDSYPSVDVFLPSCGESLDVIANTYRHVARLEWPGRLTVVVLDDSVREDVEYLAASFGFQYHVRPNPGYLKKAGNLHHGYHHSSGDFITILDADFVPRQDYLLELMPYFEEVNDGRTVGIVQSPQYFDADKSMNWLQRAAGAGQEYFYRWVQPGRDRSNGAICVGTSAIYRRAALDRAGGFAQIDHSEDVHTGINMNKVGYVVRYVPVILTKGLCPDELNTYINQQYRWCTGSMSLLFDKNFHTTPMPLIQRGCFWSGFLFYISTGLAVFWGPLPPILLGLFRPEVVRPSSYVFCALALIIWYLTHPFTTTAHGNRIGIARAQIVYSFAHIRSMWDVARNRPADWIPSGVGSAPRGTSMATKVRALMAGYLIAVQLALTACLVWRAPQYGWDNYWPLAVFAAANLYLIGPLLHGRLTLTPYETIITDEARYADKTPTGQLFLGEPHSVGQRRSIGEPHPVGEPHEVSAILLPDTGMPAQRISPRSAEHAEYAIDIDRLIFGSRRASR